LVAEQRHTRDGDDLRIRESGGRRVSRLADCRRATNTANVDSCRGDCKFRGTDHDVQSRTRAGNSRLPMPHAPVLKNLCNLWIA